MKKTIKLFILGFILIILVSFLSPITIFPSDVLNYLPSFSLNNWDRPHNSLLADPVFQFEPWRHYAKTRILKGEFPFWNNLNGEGSPFFANPQTAVLYPLNFIYYLFPEKNALFLIPILKLYFFGFFTFFYLRSLKFSLQIGIIASLTATFSAFPIVWLLWPHTNVFILFPLILFLTENIRPEKNTSHRFYILIAFFYLIGILGGHPETLFHLGIIHVIYVLLRFWQNKKIILSVYLSILAGILLGSFQVFPFVEYVSNSYLIDKRFLSQVDFYLPIKSFIVNFIPFILGAPHQLFYKPFESTTNFQEVIGGYISPAIMLFILTAWPFVKKDKIFYVWTAIVLGSFLIVYRIWPFYLITNIPLFSSIANTRLVGFAGFGIIILFALLFEKIIKVNSLAVDKFKIIIYFLSFIIFSLLISKFFSGIFITKFNSDKLILFFPFLINHLIYITITTLIFFIILTICLKRPKFERENTITFLVFPIVLQTLILFWNYNTTTTFANYYPETDLIRELKQYPNGIFLEVGNLALPPNVNLLYGLKQIENDDALEIRYYRNNFDKLFPIKNQWKKVDKIEYKNLEKLGVKYIISDYDLNLLHFSLQNKYEKILSPIISENPVRITFNSPGIILKQIRILTANFNRKNSCILKIKILEKKGKQLNQATIYCSDIRDFMYYSIPFNEINLDKNKQYEIIIESINSSTNNSIALWGNKEGIPFIDILYQKSFNDNNYKLLWNKKSIYLWEVPNAKNIIFQGDYKIIEDGAEKVIIETNSKNDEKFEIKHVMYPGWTAVTDGNPVELDKNDIFISFQIPKGQHIVEIKYFPLSFYIGSIVSLTLFFIIIIYLFRKEKKIPFWQKVNIESINFAKKVQKKIKWWNHIYIFIFSMCTSTIIFTYLVYNFPIQFKTPKTTAVNWLTVYNYPKQQDYFYFIAGFVFISIVNFLIWVIQIWRKKSF